MNYPSEIKEEEGVRWIIFNPRQNIVESFAWGLGTKMNNEVEWIALYHGLELIVGKTIPKLVFFDDSRQVIQKMRAGYYKGSSKCKIIYDRILLLKPLPQVLFYHILRENNGLADKLANHGARSPQGVIFYNGKIRSHTHVP